MQLVAYPKLVPCAVFVWCSHAYCIVLCFLSLQSLADLQKALTGSIGMSDQLDALGSCLLNGFLPNAWRKLAPATEKTLGAWMIHFQVHIHLHGDTSICTTMRTSMQALLAKSGCNRVLAVSRLPHHVVTPASLIPF